MDNYFGSCRSHAWLVLHLVLLRLALSVSDDTDAGLNWPIEVHRLTHAMSKFMRLSVLFQLHYRFPRDLS